MQEWRIRVRGKQRKVVDVGLVVQAVIALGKQLQGEAQPLTVHNQNEPASAQDTAKVEEPTECSSR